MANTIKVEIEGFEELKRKLVDPKLAREPIKEMLEEAAKLGQDTAVKAISGGLGMAKLSILHRTYSRGMAFTVKTMIAKPRAMSIEHGRKPGEVVPYLQAARHVTGRRGLTRRRLEEERLPDADHRAVRRMQEYIRVHGAKGKGYMVAAREAVEKELPRLKEVAMRRLKGLFYR